MPTKKITDLTVTNTKPPASGRLEIWDTRVTGLGLRITDKNARSWCVMYRSPTERDDKGKPRLRRVTIGEARVIEDGPGLSIADARKIAGEMLDKVTLGVDPSPSKQQAEKAAAEAQSAADKEAAEKAKRHFPSVVDKFKAQHINVNLKSGKSRDEATRIVDQLAKRWRDKQITEIDEADINDLLNEIEARGALVMAKNTRRQIKTLFEWCKDQGLLKVNGARVAPPTDFIKKAPKTFSRERTLLPDEIRIAMKAYDRMGGIYAQVFKLMALTAQRENEVAGMRWTEIDNLDGDSPIWRIPGERTKNGKAHLVHLSSQAATIIKERLKVRAADDKGNKSAFVFPGRDKPMDQHISSFSRPCDRVWEKITEIKKKDDEPEHLFAKDFTPHDWRRTFASLANQELRVRREVSDKVLNHTTRGVAGIYDRAEYLDERKAALIAWGNYVEALTKKKPSNVVALKR